MLKRKYMQKLIAWKNAKTGKALIVHGARQVGKTYLVEAFGREHYTSFIPLNFLETPSLKDIFSGDLSAASILSGIKLHLPHEKLINGDTLLFLDEIQECPSAITALKFLAADQDIDVIASGSALGMAYSRVTSFPVGYVEYLDMTALDFSEYLWAAGIDEDVIQTIHSHYTDKTPVPISMHKQMLHYLREYMVLGGMPEVVKTYVESGDYHEADKVQRRIYRDYLADIARFAEPNLKIKAEACYRSIPDQLNKTNHKFQYSMVEKRGTARKFESSVDWIINADMAIQVHNVSHIEYPLRAHKMTDSMRLYPTDIGLLICTYDYDLKRHLLQDTMDEPAENIILKTAKGGLYEALIADMLYKNGHRDLYFYRNDTGTAELEFFMDGPDGVIPIEVKAGRSASKTLNKILKQKEDIVRGYKLSSQNVGVQDKKITLPLYMAMFL